MLRVVLVCKLNDNTVNERFKYQCSIDFKNTTFRAYTRYQVNAQNVDLITSIRSKRRVFNIYATLVLKSFIYSIIVSSLGFAYVIPGESEKTWGVWRTVTPYLAIRFKFLRTKFFRASQESDLDHKPFPIEIGHFMHLLKKIFFVRPCMENLQTGEAFD